MMRKCNANEYIVPAVIMKHRPHLQTNFTLSASKACSSERLCLGPQFLRLKDFCLIYQDKRMKVLVVTFGLVPVGLTHSGSVREVGFGIISTF